MNSTIEHRQDGTIALTITIAWESVSKAKERVIEELVTSVELPGFRKGKVPRKMAEEKLDQNKIYDDVIQKLLPQAYSDAIKEHALRPIVLPKIEIVNVKEGSDWVLRALTCQKPELTIGDYKEAVRTAKSAKHKKIWTPGQPSAPEKTDEEKPHQMTLGELLEAILGVVTCKIPDLLGENEVNRQLSDLIDQTKKLGLSIDQYLASTNKTAESVRKEYALASSRTLTLEFALEAIADKENIIVSEDDIETAITAAKTDEERAALTKERYYLASILRRQKTLDFLAAV